MTIRFYLKSLFAVLIAALLFSCTNDDGGVLPSQPDPVAPPPPPSASALSLPANNEACEAGQGSGASTATVSFSWSASTNTTAYDLSVTNTATNAVSTKNNVTGTSTTLDLERGQTYSWKVTSKNNSTSTADSPSWNFSLAGMPGISTLSLPENDKACEIGEVNGNLAAVSFSWVAAENADAYDIVLTNQTTNQSSTFSDIEATETSLELERAHAYTWKVIAKNCANTNESGTTWQFYLAGEAEQNAAPFAATAVSPTPGSTVSASNSPITIAWEASDPDGDTLTYTLAVSTSESFAAASTTTFADLTANSQAVAVTVGVYFWRVTVADESISVTSDVFSFRVE